ncbi:DegV family protein [Gracilibacillus thailandensis]|uniref:DegV family EDD domain-containing protein n=1 Tax=Gracilibacillus thailandensis TaxID=563735 RepID=A0A6N7R1C1_9BACI|nr:DegV family protein [Gracilibacillus thailandensis]MRI67011.1 DegV family EDD domain-containing protein [Gracilibacillus thailandensis]
MRVAVITDSTAYIPDSYREEKNIHMVPLNVVIGNDSYQEEIDISTEEFYQKVREVEDFPKTSQPSIGLITEKLNELAKDYDQAIFITLSSGISGTFQSIVTAQSMVEGMEIFPFDSEISCMAQGFYVLEAADLAQNGEDAQTIMSRLHEIKESLRAYFMVDDLSHLHRGGRLNGAQALLGSMLQVKPILHFEDTKIVPYEKIRTKKKALKRIFELFEEDASTGVPIRATVIHANREAEAEEIKQELETRFDNVEISVSYFGPVIGTHLGEGSLGMGWYKKSGSAR